MRNIFKIISLIALFCLILSSCSENSSKPQIIEGTIQGLVNGQFGGVVATVQASNGHFKFEH
jgi:hypothetical protein